MNQAKPNCFEVGRGWAAYVGMFIVLETCLLLFTGTATEFDGDAWTDWFIILVPLHAAPTIASILVSPGFSRVHGITAFLLLLYSIFALPITLGEFDMELAIVVGLYVFSMGLFQTGWIRWTGRPGWIVRPSTRRSRAGVSLKWMIGLPRRLGFLRLRQLC